MPYTERSLLRREYVIDAPPPAGAPAAEVNAAWTAAETAYREANNLPTEAQLPEAALTFRPAPNAVVISFVVEHPPAAA